MMKWHGHKDGIETERFRYGEKVYLYNPQTGDNLFIGWNCGKHRTPLYFIQPKNTVSELVLYNENFIRHQSELSADRKCSARLEKQH